ncbi:hypothetical protein MMC11_002171 [Xylographa trunciseda]|nr:hypothetical protein [Xylographa trunciseda]
MNVYQFTGDYEHSGSAYPPPDSTYSSAPSSYSAAKYESRLVPPSIEAPAGIITAEPYSQKHVPSNRRKVHRERLSRGWSHDDDDILKEKRAQGMNWAAIAVKYFPSRTPNACRKRHERLMENINSAHWKGARIEDIGQAYLESRELMWKIVADKLGEKWQHVEAKCMEKGLKTLQTSARAPRAVVPASDTSTSFEDSGLGPDTGIDWTVDKFSSDSALCLNTEYESVPDGSSSRLQSKAPLAAYSSGSVSTLSEADVSKRHLKDRSEDSGGSRPALFKQAVPGATHRLETHKTTTLGLPNSTAALTTSLNNLSELGTSEIMRDPIHRSISPTIDLGSASPNVKFNTSILGLDADLDVLSPSQWIIEHQSIQWYTLKQSFFWFLDRDVPSINLEDQCMFVSGIHVPETLYVDSRLPTECPVRLLESSWQDFISSDTVFLRNRSSSLVHGKRSRASQGSVQECIHAFQNWLSRPGSVVDKIITGTAPGSKFDPGVLVHATSLIESRNILVTVCRTVEYLQQRGVCQKEMNLFIEDRPKVIRLISIPLARFASLAKQLNLLVGSLSWTMHGGFEILVSSDLENRRNLVSHHWLIPVLEKGHLEDLLHCSALDVLAARWRYLARVLDLAIITYCSSHLVSTVEEDSLLYQLKAKGIVEIPDSKSVFAPASLECLDEFVQGAKVWTLCNVDHLIEVSETSINSSASTVPSPSARFGISSAYVSASIESLAEIWGPVWRLQQNNQQMGSPRGYYYTLGAGAIGQWPTDQASSPVRVLSNETLSHFVPSRDRMEYIISPFEGNTGSRLLIGVAQISGLVQDESCKTSQHECLQEQDLRPHGTSLSTRYNTTTTYTLGIGYSGTQIGVSKQYQRYPSVTRKQSLIQKWTMWPDKRNPYTLLSWCGIEVSLCTRNARRRRLIHVLGSNTMAPYLDTIKWESSGCGTAFKQALAAEDLEAFPKLYSERVEWRTELGEAVAYLLTALVNTGIVHSGDLEVYTRTDSIDPDQIMTMAARTHTWAGFLKDTERTAAFVVATSDCLSLPYNPSICSGQRCRGHLSKKLQYTVLETAVAPVSSPHAPNITEKALWSQGIPSGRRLRLQSSKSDMLKVVKYLPKGEILATWSASEYIKAALLELPNSATNVRFQESTDDGTYQLLTGTKVYVISERTSGLNAVPRNNTNSSTEPCTPNSRHRVQNAQPLLLSNYQCSDAGEYSMDITMTDSSSLTPSTNPTTYNSTPEDAVQSLGAYTRCHHGGLSHIDGQEQAVTCKQCEPANMSPIAPTTFLTNDMMSKSFPSSWDIGLSPSDCLQKIDSSYARNQTLASFAYQRKRLASQMTRIDLATADEANLPTFQVSFLGAHLLQQIRLQGTESA